MSLKNFSKTISDMISNQRRVLLYILKHSWRESGALKPEDFEHICNVI